MAYIRKFTEQEVYEAKRQHYNQYLKTHHHHMKSTGNKPDILHEHSDCIHMAVEFLSAQKPTKRAQPHRQRNYDIKHMIEHWAGRYVSADDVSVAAILLGLRGKYPNYNFSTKLVFPSQSRLAGIPEAFTQEIKYLICEDYTLYTYWENDDGSINVNNQSSTI
ncbi:MAG: hypothetical protein KZQ83_18340 [gamma proteobacterium symbiont of Taylorina sp.]|nr:hypothetical protein [gamma proteobacterium symbiont of Taylorina sp.]